MTKDDKPTTDTTTKKPPPDPNKGFKIGDIVRHKKSGFSGPIERFDWLGVSRACHIPSGKANKSSYILELTDIEIVKPSKDMKPEPTTKESV